VVVSSSRPLADLRRPAALETLGLVPDSYGDEGDGAAIASLWPLLYSRTQELPLEAGAFEACRRVSQRVAQSVSLVRWVVTTLKSTLHD